VRRADKLTTFVCRVSWNLGASNSWNPLGLSRTVMGLLYLLPFTRINYKTVPVSNFNKYLHYGTSFWGGSNSPQWARASSLLMFLDHTQRRSTVGRTPLNEWSARRRDLYLTTHNNHNRQTCMPPVGFEPTISAGERPQTYTLDRAATGTGGNE